MRSTRHNIYYWKVDRPTLSATGIESTKVAHALKSYLANHLGRLGPIHPAGGLGNHHTFTAESERGHRYFIRVECGAEGDQHMEVEARLMEALRHLGLPVPMIYLVDATRRDFPWALQVMEQIPQPDLANHQRQGTLCSPLIARQIGQTIALWQQLPVHGFGPLQETTPPFQGYHQHYTNYFHLHLHRHLSLLTEAHFLSPEQADEIHEQIAKNRHLLELNESVLVHKDLALWNILGTPDRALSYIDWDDAIAGDSMDDLSLLACFMDRPFLTEALAGYSEIQPLPSDAPQRFWLHLLRNMIVKANLRIRHDLFTQRDNFIWSGQTQPDFNPLVFTRERLLLGLHSLRDKRDFNAL